MEFNVYNHNLFKELPTLGVMGDVLEAVASAWPAPVSLVPVTPPNMVLMSNLVGYTRNIPVRKEEIARS